MKLGRRRFLAGLGAGAASIPLLSRFAMSGEGGATPKLLIFLSPNGFLVGPYGSEYPYYQGWRPDGFPQDAGVGASMALPAGLPQIFQPLEGHRDRLLFLEGLKQVDTTYEYPGGGVAKVDPHWGAAGLLTGTPAIMENINGGYADIYGASISIDQYLGQRLGFEPLVLSYPFTGYPNEQFFSFLGAKQPITPIQSPVEAFDRVFTGVSSETTARRTAILRFLDEDFGSVLRNAPAADRARLEAHRDAVSKLGKSLSHAVCGSGGFTRPDNYELNYEGQNVPRAMRDYADVAVEALACGWTRAGLIQLPNTGGNIGTFFEGYDVPPGLSDHALAHGLAGDETLWEDLVTREQAVSYALTVQTAYNDMFAYILDRLAEREDVDGRSLLDNTLVMHAKVAGQNHDWERLLWVLAGGQALGVAGGQFRVVGTPQQQPYQYYNDFWTTVCHLMGLPDVETFGDPQFNRSPLVLG